MQQKDIYSPSVVLFKKYNKGFSNHPDYNHTSMKQKIWKIVKIIALVFMDTAVVLLFLYMLWAILTILCGLILLAILYLRNGGIGPGSGPPQ